MAAPAGDVSYSEPEELLDLSERSRREEGRGDKDDREHEPEAQPRRLTFPLLPLSCRATRTVEVIRALDRVRIERWRLLRRLLRLHPGHERSVSLLCLPRQQ